MEIIGIYKQIKRLIRENKREKADKLFNEIKTSYEGIYVEIYSKLIEGLHVYSENNYAAALEIFFDVKRFSTEMDDTKLQAEILAGINMCYHSLCNFNKAADFVLQALELQPHDIYFLNSAGTSYLKNGQEKKALHYYRQCLKEIDKQPEVEFSKAIPYLNIGNIYQKRGELGQAEEMYDKTLALADIDLHELRGHLLFCKAIIAHDIGNKDKAVSVLEKAYELVMKANDRIFEMKILYRLSVFYREGKEFEKAINCLEKYIQLFEVTFNEQTTSKISELQVKLEQERKEKLERETLLKSEKQAVEMRLKSMQDAYASVVGVGKVGVFSKKMSNILKMADFFHTDRNVPVLIEGETGTGKEIIARIIHYGKGNFTGPFVVINCSAISPALFESELFGYEEGAFTGAKTKGMIGKFEFAQGGTIFLDEIGELPMELQPKLLRVLQQKEIIRVGGNKSIKLDVRVICATNRDLKQEMIKGNFRSDLYYRLNTGSMYIPPLKERIEEIKPLTQMFLLDFATKKKRNFKYINEDALDILERYDWPGNVRELQNAIERVLLLYNDVEIKPEHLNFISGEEENFVIANNNNLFTIALPETGLSMEELYRAYMKFALDKFDGNKSKAAEFIKISRTSFYRKKI